MICSNGFVVRVKTFSIYDASDICNAFLPPICNMCPANVFILVTVK